MDDVIRGWNWPRGILAVLAAGLATLVVMSSIAELTDQSVDRPDPELGDSPLFLLGMVGIVLVALGGVAAWLGWGWGLLVPGGLVLVIWLASVPFERRMQTITQEDRARVSRDLDAIGSYGQRLARFTGAGFTAVLIWVVARAGAFDLFVRQEQAPEVVLVLLVQDVVIAALLAVGVLTLLLPAGSWRGWWAWGTTTALALGLLLATLRSSWSVSWPQWWGTVTILLLGVAASSGLLCLVVVIARGIVRRRPRRLAPALWMLRLKRFPAVGFAVVWVVLIELLTPLLSSAGFHDIKVTSDPTLSDAPPTLEQAYESWIEAGAQRGQVRPMVLVAAQGGGIRAAVWTALVMECVFGPGPLSDTGEACAGGSSAENPTATDDAVNNTTLPVFLASGASGGSIGLAVWTARRVDLATGAPPSTNVEAAFKGDFVAPDMARLLTGDLAHLFLAHNGPDRASVFEQALASGPGGLSRGLRDSWRQANGSGKWQIPVLALNGFQVEDGCRFVASPVDFEVSVANRRASKNEVSGQQVAPEGDLDIPADSGCGTSSALTPESAQLLRAVLPRTTELADYLCPGQDVSLATAGHLSARFPYVSPSARVSRQECDSGGLLPRKSVSYVLDGGIYDNSGATTAQEAWRALSAQAAAREKEKPGSCIVPLFLQIDNSADEVAQERRPPAELLAPIQALFQEINSRESVARTSAAVEFSPLRSPAGSEIKDNRAAIESLWFNIVLSGQPGFEPPLGWALAESTIKDMRYQLRAGKNSEQIAKLRQLLASTTLTCGQPTR